MYSGQPFAISRCIHCTGFWKRENIVYCLSVLYEACTIAISLNPLIKVSPYSVRVGKPQMEIKDPIHPIQPFVGYTSYFKFLSYSKCVRKTSSAFNAFLSKRCQTE